MAFDVSKKMLEVYKEEADPKMGFLTSFFKTKPQYITDSEEIEYDIVRSGAPIAPVLTDVSTGAHVISKEVFTNKTIKPPTFVLQEPFSRWDMGKRQPGETVYGASTGNTMIKLAGKLVDSWKRMSDMVRRTIELQAAQILQTGTITLYNSANVAAYTLDFKMKATHLPTVGTSWSNGAADIIGDIKAACEVVRKDGRCNIKTLLMDDLSFTNALNNTLFANLFKKDQFNLGALNPSWGGVGETYQGFVIIGSYRLDIYTYPVTYTSIAGAETKYLSDNKVIGLPDMNELDFRKCFGGIPDPIAQEAEFVSMMPSRIVEGNNLVWVPRIFSDPVKNAVYSELASRPILIPVSIDRFFCITTLH